MSWQEIYSLGPDVFEAIYRAYPDVTCIDGDLGAFDDADARNLVQLDIDVVKAVLAEIQAEQAATAYQRQRAPEYPPLTDLADALFWASRGDDSKLISYYAACESVKAKYPKPA